MHDIFVLLRFRYRRGREEPVAKLLLGLLRYKLSFFADGREHKRKRRHYAIGICCGSFPLASASFSATAAAVACAFKDCCIFIWIAINLGRMRATTRILSKVAAAAASNPLVPLLRPPRPAPPPLPPAPPPLPRAEALPHQRIHISDSNATTPLDWFSGHPGPPRSQNLERPGRTNRHVMKTMV